MKCQLLSTLSSGNRKVHTNPHRPFPTITNNLSYLCCLATPAVLQPFLGGSSIVETLGGKGGGEDLSVLSEMS